MFLTGEQGVELAGGTNARALRPAPLPAPPFGASLGAASFGRALVRETDLHPLERLRIAAQRVDWVPDLGSQIGTLAWWRGLLTCTALCAATWALAPGFRPVTGVVPAPLAGAEADEARAQGIAPLALGADTGRRMAATDLAVPLAEAPERPQIELSATLGEGDRFERMLERAGVARADASAAAALVGQTTDLGAIAPGTAVSLTLGRRASRLQPRPLDALRMRARFDMGVTLARAEGGLTLTRQPIAIDRTPLRLQGLAGSSLYRSARAAGAPAKAVETYLKALASRLSIGSDVLPSDRFDLVIERERAATGETRMGSLLFAGLARAQGRTQLVRWTVDGEEGWFDADGRIERRGQMGLPVQGRVTSNFGWRVHPILGFVKLHKGLDIAAPWGSPIYAAIDGVVSFTGRAGGYGNFVKLSHQAGLVSGYGHMSRVAVRPGEHVRRGEVIGYVGSTGLSTGPHLHWEIWRNGTSINPRSISFDSIGRLSGAKLAAFRAQVAGLLAVRPGL